MNIRGKMLSVIAFALLATALANFFVLKILVFPTFLKLEQQAAARNIQRVIEAINSEVDDVDKTLWDYSSWDDSYKYAQGKYKSYPKSNLAVETLQNLHLDIVEVYDKHKDNLISIVFDRAEGRIRDVSWTLGGLGEDRRLQVFADDSSKIAGAILTPDGPALVSSRPIVKTNGEGPSVGTFIFARFLDDALVATIKERIKVDFSLMPIDRLSEAERSAYRQLLQTGQTDFIEQTSEDQLVAYALIHDIDGKPMLMASAKVKRDISRTGQRVLLASVGGVALTAILVMALLAILLQWVLVGPLVRLTEQVVEVGVDASLDRRLTLPRRDEIGILSREFDRMLASLAEARRRLLDHSYQSGIAHMASGVLHNLRNQLMPAMTRVERLHDRIVGDAALPLDRVLTEFACEQTPLDRKAKIATYLALSVQDMRERQDGIAADLQAVSHDLVRVEDVLGDLDRFSRVSSKIDAVSLAACVQETMATLPSFPDVAVNIQIAPDLASAPLVASENFILRHVLQNLFVNAMEAIIAAGRASGTIGVTAEQRTLADGDFVDLAIHDDGIGIAPEHAPELFKRGFSTKKATRRGAGLHWCANSVTAMSGKIHAESAGPNQGATLHVLLKVADAVKQAA